MIALTALRNGLCCTAVLMITIAITPKAFGVITTTLLKRYEAELWSDGIGGYFVTLPNGVLDELMAIREVDESYSDVIIRGARGVTLPNRAASRRTWSAGLSSRSPT